MRIRMMADGRVLEGTAKQIAEAMHALAFGQENRTLSEYIDWAVDQARRMNEIDLEVEGDTDDEKAQSRARDARGGAGREAVSGQPPAHAGIRRPGFTPGGGPAIVVPARAPSGHEKER